MNATLRPHCRECGHYLLPCIATANGAHPEIVTPDTCPTGTHALDLA